MRQDSNKPNEGFLSDESADALKSLRSVSAEPSLYFKTRVLAQMREQKKAKQSLFRKFFIPSALAFSFALIMSFLALQKQTQNQTEVASYIIGQPYVIRMDIRPYKESGVAYAEILLSDDNVQFSSSQFEKISQQKKLVVAWETVVQKQFLPIVIKGVQSGNSKVIVNFYDSENKLVNSQNVNLNFKGG